MVVFRRGNGHFGGGQFGDDMWKKLNCIEISVSVEADRNRVFSLVLMNLLIIFPWKLLGNFGVKFWEIFREYGFESKLTNFFAEFCEITEKFRRKTWQNVDILQSSEKRSRG